VGLPLIEIQFNIAREEALMIKHLLPLFKYLFKIYLLLKNLLIAVQELV